MPLNVFSIGLELFVGTVANRFGKIGNAFCTWPTFDHFIGYVITGFIFRYIKKSCQAWNIGFIKFISKIKISSSVFIDRQAIAFNDTF
ncbi:hypothetical protein D3C81_565950 [compost metagenome]